MILGSLGKALGRILGGKFGGGKQVEKQVVRMLASAGDADPSKEGFREDKGQGGRIQHASAHPSDGRADCLRFAAPAEATWRLEAWKSMKIDEQSIKTEYMETGN